MEIENVKPSSENILTVSLRVRHRDLPGGPVVHRFDPSLGNLRSCMLCGTAKKKKKKKTTKTQTNKKIRHKLTYHPALTRIRIYLRKDKSTQRQDCVCL